MVDVLHLPSDYSLTPEGRQYMDRYAQAYQVQEPGPVFQEPPRILDIKELAKSIFRSFCYAAPLQVIVTGIIIISNYKANIEGVITSIAIMALLMENAAKDSGLGRERIIANIAMNALGVVGLMTYQATCELGLSLGIGVSAIAGLITGESLGELLLDEIPKKRKILVGSVLLLSSQLVTPFAYLFGSNATMISVAALVAQFTFTGIFILTNKDT